MSDVTRILDRVQQGEVKAAEELMPLVYDELRKLAAHKMAHEAPDRACVRFSRSIYACKRVLRKFTQEAAMQTENRVKSG